MPMLRSRLAALSGLLLAAALLAGGAIDSYADEPDDAGAGEASGPPNSDMPNGEEAFPGGSDDFPQAAPEATGPVERDTAGWIPSLAVGVDVQSQTFSGVVDSEIRGLVTGDRSFVSANPTLRAEIMSPVLLEIAGRPRLFAHAGWQWGWLVSSDERFVAKEGSPGDVVIEQGKRGTAPPPRNYDGQGSEVDAKVDNGWYAGLGVAFFAPIADYDFRIKGSVDYFQQEMSYQGTVHNVICNEVIVANAFRCQLSSQIVQIVDGESSNTLHALGPRVGVELDVAKRGPMALSIFLEGFVYWYLGSRSETFIGSNGTDDALFSVKSDALVGGGSAGLRVSWRGF